MFQLTWKVRLDEPLGTATRRVSVLVRSSPEPLHHCSVPSRGVGSVVVTTFGGSTVTSACGFAELYSCGPRSMVFCCPATAIS